VIHQPVRIVCPKCEAEYEIPAEALPAAGRDMKCSGCAHAWYQLAQPIRPSGPAKAVAGSGVDAAMAKAETAAAHARVPAWSEPQPEVEPEIEDEPAPEIRVPPRRIDPQVLEILQQEAEREVLARKSASSLPARPRPREIVDPRKEIGNTIRDRLARLQEAERERSGKAAPKPAKEKPAKEPFPDIASLRPAKAKPAPPYTTLPARAQKDTQLPAILSPRDIVLTTIEREQRGFRIGFLLPVVLIVAGLALYAAAPRIGASYPAAAPMLERVHQGGSAILVSLDAQIRGAFAAIAGRVGS
jgi:predicted Zn finger-like uncharacterized protein